MKSVGGLFLALAVGLILADVANAQAPQRKRGADGQRNRNSNGGRQRGSRRGGFDRSQFVSPLMKALDTDGDGTLSAEEIANATKTLMALDKNKDGKLTPDELRPAGFGNRAGFAGRGGFGARGSAGIGNRGRGGFGGRGRGPGGPGGSPKTGRQRPPADDGKVN